MDHSLFQTEKQSLVNGCVRGPLRSSANTTLPQCNVQSATGMAMQSYDTEDRSNVNLQDVMFVGDWEKYPEMQMQQPSGIEATLAERGSRYGEFDEHARITQAIKAAIRSGRNYNKLTFSMVEALEMTAHKIGRIVNGDPYYTDSWHDIIGYIRLVEKQLEELDKPVGSCQIPETPIV
jgi:hypothetical protein